MKPVLLSAYTTTSCLGRGLAPTRAAFRAASSGLAPCRFETVDLNTCVGEIPGLDDVALPPGLGRFDCRNNRASEVGLAQDGFLEKVEEAALRYGRHRAGVFIGTSTAGILQTELAYRRRDPASGALPPDFDYRRTHNTFSAAEFVRTRLGLTGPWAGNALCFLNPDGTMPLVITNPFKEEREVVFAYAEGVMSAKVPARSFNTFLIRL